MNRRGFLQSSVVFGVPVFAIPTASQRAGGSLNETPAGIEDSSSIPHGQYIHDQAQYDDGTTPSERPAYERIADEIIYETHTTIRTSRLLTENLYDRLRSHDLCLNDLSISKQIDGSEIRLFVEYPDDTAEDCQTVIGTALEDWQAVVETALEESHSELGETHRERLDDLEIEIDHRQRPTARPEYGCTSTVGRFADAQYRENGIAMGAAVRSETLGEIASSGFRGLHEGHAVVVTTAHTFETSDDHEPSELRGATLYQSRRPHAIGRCHAVGRDYGPGVDAAAVAVDQAEYPSRFLADPGGDSYYDEPIVGTASWQLLETHLAEDRPIYKQGAVTGRCEGRILELREFSGGYRELAVDIHSDGGDSGGPYFVRSEEGLLVAAIHKGVRTNGTERRAIFVESVCESLGVDFY